METLKNLAPLDNNLDTSINISADEKPFDDGLR